MNKITITKGDMVLIDGYDELREVSIGNDKTADGSIKIKSYIVAGGFFVLPIDILKVYRQIKN